MNAFWWTLIITISIGLIIILIIKMALFKKKPKAEVSYKFLLLNADFTSKYKEVQKVIKKDSLTDKIIYEYRFICESLCKFLTENKEQLMKENVKLTEQNFPAYINQMKIQIDWCDKQIAFRKEIAKGKDYTEFKDKLDEVAKNRK